MRILFVSGSGFGGSVRSTRELAERLAARGHAVGVVLRVDRDPRVTAVHKRAVNLRVKLAARPATRIAARPVGALAATMGRRLPPLLPAGDVPQWDTTLPENALPAIRKQFRPDVVVVNSIDRMAWRRIRALLAQWQVPSVLYLREEAALGHLSISAAPPDLLVANADAYAERAAELGYPATMIPSVVSLEEHVTTRTRVLFVNPVPTYGLDVALGLAAARPDVPFAFTEWWPVEGSARQRLEARVGALANVELRATTQSPAILYADARVLLVPFEFDMRTRMVPEAQFSGIPVLGSDLPALRETIGPGGLVVAPDAPVASWADALAEIVDDPAREQVLGDAARAHARRADIDPERVVDRFEAALGGLVGAGRR